MAKKVKSVLNTKPTKNILKEVKKALAGEHLPPTKSIDEMLQEQEEKMPYLVFGMTREEYEKQVEAKRKEIESHEDTGQS